MASFLPKDWAGPAGLGLPAARRCPREERPSAWRVGRSGAGGLGQERESEVFLRSEATARPLGSWLAKTGASPSKRRHGVQKSGL